MARPREFDEDAVLDKALQLFWSKGYDATSIDDLVVATGLSRASLYGAFGDKAQLFRTILTRYREQLAAELAACVQKQPSARAAIEALFAASIDRACPSAGPRGCLLAVATALPTPADDETRALLTSFANETEKLVTRLVREGQASDEVDDVPSAASLARFLTVTLQGLATAARAGRSKKELREVAAHALSVLAPRRRPRGTPNASA